MRHNCMNKDDPDALQNRSVLNSCTVCAGYFKLEPWFRTLGKCFKLTTPEKITIFALLRYDPGCCDPGCCDPGFDGHLLWRSRAGDKLSP